MTQHQINKLIAAEMHRRGVFLHFTAHRGVIHYETETTIGSQLNMFTSSLDSCRLFEDTLSPIEWEQYSVHLANGYNKVRDKVSYQRYICELTPALRCEAFLRLIEKFEESDGR